VAADWLELGDCAGRITALRGTASADEQGAYTREIDLQRDLDVLEAAIKATPDCRLVVVHPIGAYLGKTDSHNNSEVRQVLAPLAEMAARLGVAILAIHHLNKGDGSAKHRVTGSLAFTAAPRAVWAVAPDNSDPRRSAQGPGRTARRWPQSSSS